MKAYFAFTMIEIITVIIIVAILGLIAVPSYNSYLIQSRRTDAVNAMRDNQLIVENYIQSNGITPTSLQVTLATVSTAGYYDLSYTRVNDSRYRIVATAVSSKSQNNDTGCTTLTLTSELDFIYPENCR